MENKAEGKRVEQAFQACGEAAQESPASAAEVQLALLLDGSTAAAEADFWNGLSPQA